jgi:hypothetical protein
MERKKPTLFAPILARAFQFLQLESFIVNCCDLKVNTTIGAGDNFPFHDIIVIRNPFKKTCRAFSFSSHFGIHVEIFLLLDTNGTYRNFLKHYESIKTAISPRNPTGSDPGVSLRFHVFRRATIDLEAHDLVLLLRKANRSDKSKRKVQTLRRFSRESAKAHARGKNLESPMVDVTISSAIALIRQGSQSKFHWKLILHLLFTILKILNAFERF